MSYPETVFAEFETFTARAVKNGWDELVIVDGDNDCVVLPDVWAEQLRDFLNENYPKSGLQRVREAITKARGADEPPMQPQGFA